MLAQYLAIYSTSILRGEKKGRRAFPSSSNPGWRTRKASLSLDERVVWHKQYSSSFFFVHCSLLAVCSGCFYSTVISYLATRQHLDHLMSLFPPTEPSSWVDTVEGENFIDQGVESNPAHRNTTRSSAGTSKPRLSTNAVSQQSKTLFFAELSKRELVTASRTSVQLRGIRFIELGPDSLVTFERCQRMVLSSFHDDNKRGMQVTTYAPKGARSYSSTAEQYTVSIQNDGYTTMTLMLGEVGDSRLQTHLIRPRIEFDDAHKTGRGSNSIRRVISGVTLEGDWRFI